MSQASDNPVSIPIRHPVICVLGMHRSGTSALVGSLQSAGLNLGKHHTWNRYNRRGNRENQDIVDLNEKILKDNGGSWEYPPDRVRITASHTEQARAIVSAVPAELHWGFKDPRTLLTLSMWHTVLPPDFRRIGIFRHPLAVAASLGFRHGAEVMSEERALNIWYHYNRKLLQEYKRSPFPVLCFDWEDKLFLNKLQALYQPLGLQAEAQERIFYTSSLKNYGSNDLSIIPRKYRQLYKKLRAIAV